MYLIFLQINILEGRAGYVVLKGHISVTISYLSRWLTTETVNYIKENSFIENLAKLQYSMWAQRGKQMKKAIRRDDVINMPISVSAYLESKFGETNFMVVLS